MTFADIAALVSGVTPRERFTLRVSSRLLLTLNREILHSEKIYVVDFIFDWRRV